MSMAGILASLRMVITLVLVVVVMGLMVALAAADRVFRVEEASTD